MSFLDPWSPDHTSSSSPTFACLIPRMSSISGPGQKDPRASRMIRWLVDAAMVRASSQEERDAALGRPAQEFRDADHVVDDRVEVFLLHVHEVVGRGAGVDLDVAHLLRLAEHVVPGRHLLRHHDLHHHGSGLRVVRVHLHVRLRLALAERLQAVERHENLDVLPERHGPGGHDRDGVQLVDGAAKDHERESVLHGLPPWPPSASDRLSPAESSEYTNICEYAQGRIYPRPPDLTPWSPSTSRSTKSKPPTSRSLPIPAACI